MRQVQFQEFRTPQHPSSGTNNWGGASPLLARDIPKESLDERYSRLNSIRTHDEIFRAQDFDFNYSQDASSTPHYEVPPTPSTHRKGFLTRFMFPDEADYEVPPTPGRLRGFLRSMVLPQKEKASQSMDPKAKKRRWFRRRDPRNRWPNGWG